MFVSSSLSECLCLGISLGAQRNLVRLEGEERRVQICCVLGIDRYPGMHLEDKMHAV